MCFFVSHLLEAWTQLQAEDNSLVSPQRVGGLGYIVSFPVCVFFVYKMKQSWHPSTYALSSPTEVMTFMCGMSLFWYLLLAKLQPVSLQNRLGKVYLNACCTHQGDMDPGQGDLVLVLISIALPLRWPHGQSGSVPAVSFLCPWLEEVVITFPVWVHSTLVTADHKRYLPWGVRQDSSPHEGPHGQKEQEVYGGLSAKVCVAAVGDCD